MDVKVIFPMIDIELLLKSFLYIYPMLVLFDHWLQQVQPDQESLKKNQFLFFLFLIHLINFCCCIPTNHF